MASTGSEAIRNVALIGHGGSGKTTLAEALVFAAGATTRLGRVDDGTSIFDYDDEERERKFTIRCTLGNCAWKNHRVNLVDTPGYSDFVGDVYSALSAVEGAIVTIDAVAGIGINTRRLYRLAEERGLARVIVVTKLDGDSADFATLLDTIREQFGKAAQVLTMPIGEGAKFSGTVNLLHLPETMPDGVVGDPAAARDALLETVIETDDALMERYLDGQEIDAATIAATFTKAVAAGAVVPILCVSAAKGAAVDTVLDAIADLLPSPVKGIKRAATPADKKDAEPVALEPDPAKPFVAQVFKIVSDPFVGKLCYLRVYQGSFKGEGANLTNVRTGKAARVTQLFRMMGKEQQALKEPAIAGDLVTVAKIEDLQINDSVVAGGPPLALPPITVPEPMVSLAVEPKSRGDEQKISAALARLAEEELMIRTTRDAQTRELVLSGTTALHLDVVLSRLKRQFGVEVTTRPPKIAYRETITKAAQYVEYTHKKQTGGAGQYARVAIDMEPTERGAGYEFVDDIVGGVIDQQFRPSVDKGIQKKLVEGVLAGYPVVDVRVKLVDGKTHPVDSKDIAFQVAGREAFKKAFMMCGPVILEPIVNVEITVPSRAMGDITGDLNSRRGRILGVDQVGDEQVVRATAPLAEMLTYSTQLRSITGGEGSFTMTLSHYDLVPSHIQQQLIAQATRKEDEDA